MPDCAAVALPQRLELLHALVGGGREGEALVVDVVLVGVALRLRSRSVCGVARLELFEVGEERTDLHRFLHLDGGGLEARLLRDRVPERDRQLVRGARPAVRAGVVADVPVAVVEGDEDDALPWPADACRHDDLSRVARRRAPGRPPRSRAARRPPRRARPRRRARRPAVPVCARSSCACGSGRRCGRSSA